MEYETSGYSVILKRFLAVACVAIAVSIIIQDYSGYLSSPIFNQNRGLYFACSVFVLLIAIGLFAATLLAKRRRIHVFILMLFVYFYGLECAVRLFDHFFIDRPRGLIGHYYNRDSIISRRPTSTNNLGFNESYDYSKEMPPGKKRIIFLGDSYTFGSGSTPEKSYCKVVEEYLNEHSQMEYEIFNAGVPGYSPLDSYNLFRHLKKEGYQYDAVVFSLFLQNDMMDYMKNTERKAVCGFIQRFPKNVFLQYINPLNSYVFRYSLVAFVYFRIKRSMKLEEERKRALKQTNANPPEEHRINPLTYKRIKRNYLKTENHDFEHVYSIISGIADECAGSFHIIVIPDQFFGDRKVKQHVLQSFDENEYDFWIYYNWINEHLAEFSYLDVTNVIQNCGECYKDNDMHLNDEGNRVLGNAVGRYLFAQEHNEETDALSAKVD